MDVGSNGKPGFAIEVEEPQVLAERAKEPKYQRGLDAISVPNRAFPGPP